MTVRRHTTFPGCTSPCVPLDDAEVVRAHRSPTSEKKPPTRETSPEPTADEGEDTEIQDQEDISMEEEPVQKRPKKIKEEWPVGRNGLRKRRTEKERMSIDDKGYMGEWLEASFQSVVFLRCVALAVETYSEYESIASESEEPSLEEVKKAGRKVKAVKKGIGKEKTLKSLTKEESITESSEKKNKAGSGSASKKENPKEEERKAALGPAPKLLSKPVKSVPAWNHGQKTLNSFFGKE